MLASTPPSAGSWGPRHRGPVSLIHQDRHGPVHSVPLPEVLRRCGGPGRLLPTWSALSRTRDQAEQSPRGAHSCSPSRTPWVPMFLSTKCLLLTHGALASGGSHCTCPTCLLIPVASDPQLTCGALQKLSLNCPNVSAICLPRTLTDPVPHLALPSSCFGNTVASQLWGPVIGVWNCAGLQRQSRGWDRWHRGPRTLRMGRGQAAGSERQDLIPLAREVVHTWRYLSLGRRLHSQRFVRE